MKTGLLEKALVRRYGTPTISTKRGIDAHCWNPDEFDYASVLYMGMKWHEPSDTRLAALKEIYGDACGGFLVKNLLRVAVLLPREIYGLWQINQLHKLPPVRQATEMDPAIVYFMESANVWYYGHKAGELYVFDSQTDELDSLGPVEQALDELIDQWENDE